jgi:hypothetical protein
MLVGSALLAAAAAVAAVLAKASETTWALLISIVTLLILMAAVVRLEVLRKRDAVTSQDVYELRGQIALVESRQYLASLRGTMDDNLFEDAVHVLAGALVSGWTVSCRTKDAELQGLDLTSPPVNGQSVTWVMILPLTPKHVDATGRFVMAHGAPLTKLATGRPDEPQAKTQPPSAAT